MLSPWPTYGYRRITAQLRRGKWRVNRKRVQRLMRLMDLQAEIRRRERRTTHSEHGFPRYPNVVQNLKVVQPEQVWVADITYIRLQSNFVTWQCSWMCSPVRSAPGAWDVVWTIP